MREAPAVGASIVIIGRNEAENLSAALDSAAAAAARLERELRLSSEILYVDSYSTDGSPAIAREKGARVALPPRRFMSAANGRNTGLHLAAGEYVMMMDGDMALASGWLARGIEFLDAHPEAAGVAGIRNDLRRRGKGFELIPNYTRITKEDELVTRGLGGACLFRRSALTALGGYDPALPIDEEAALLCALRAAGWSVYRIAAPMILHRDTKLGDAGTALSRLLLRREARLPGMALRRALFCEPWGGKYLACHADLVRHALWLLLFSASAGAALLLKGHAYLAALALALFAGYVPALALEKQSLPRGLAAVFLRTGYLANLCAGFVRGPKDVRFGSQHTAGYWKEIEELNGRDPGFTAR
ncbi:MAG: glycosyltransferase family A protein [Endomicrobiales bacterium]